MALTRPEDNRRDVPEDTGAMSCLGFGWDEIVELLSERIAKAAPEVRRAGKTIWSVRAHANGIRILFFEDEDAYRKFLQTSTMPMGPQVHAGRIAV